MTVEAVIFDFGGVITSSPFERFNRFEAENGLPRDLIRQVNARLPDGNAWARFERGQIDVDAFDVAFLAESTALGHPLSGRAVLPLIDGEVRPRMVAALMACKARFKVGCITNNVISPHSPDAASPSGRVFELFDVALSSSAAGVRKPDPRIYLMMCEALAVAPQACVYLDDLGINCKPAAELGMTAIKVLSEDQALEDLSRVTGLPLTDLEPPQ